MDVHCAAYGDVHEAALLLDAVAELPGVGFVRSLPELAPAIAQLSAPLERLQPPRP